MSGVSKSLQCNRSNQQGVSLIEVLVSMVLGIFFLGVAVQYLIVGQQSNQVQDAGSRIQENARFASSILQDTIRHGGYKGDPAVTTIPDIIFTGNCGGFNPCSGDGADNLGDSIAISLIADGNVSQDCLGNAVAAETWFANVFWVQEVNGVRSLYCRGWNITAGAWISDTQPLVDGIEQIQVQYGLSDIANEDIGGPVVNFLSATSVPTADDWDYVRSVRVALLVDSGLQTDESDRAGITGLQAENTTYALLDGPDYTPGDDRIRRVYTSTIEINNSFQ